MRTPHAYDERPTVTEAELHEWIAHVDDPTRARFEKITGHLPRDVEFGLAAHSLPILEEVLAITAPQHIVEIGFGGGCSASMFLDLSQARRVVSIDWTPNERAIGAAREMEERHRGRFVFLNRDSRTLDPREVYSALGYAVPDLVFVDGGHEYETVASDLRLAAAFGTMPDPDLDGMPTRWLLLDDWWPHLGPGVQPAVSAWGREYELHKQWGNMVLLEFARPESKKPKPRRR